MTQIRARPRHLFSWDLSRGGWWSSDFLLTADQEVWARATKESAFVRRFVVRTAERELILEPAALFARSFRLVENAMIVGYVLPDHFFTRACTLEFPDDLPAPVQVFLFWLVALMWRRAARAAASS